MKKNIQKCLFLAFVLLLLPINTYASSNFNKRTHVLEFLQEAYQSQIKLSEKERSYEETEKILAPYFTEDYIDLFLNENLFEIDGKYITLGSDFSLYYLPFFKLNEKTKIVPYQQKIYVYEYFPENEEGPVSYRSHYEGILLEFLDGAWKVSESIYGKIPEQVITLGRQAKKENLTVEEEGIIVPKYLFNRITLKSSFDLFSGKLILPIQQKDDSNHQWER